MKKKYNTIVNENGIKEKHRKDLKKELNVNYLTLSNLTKASPYLDLPEIICNTTIFPDYLALYSEPGMYKKTAKTAVSFFEFDNEFDGQRGLFNAIYYKNKQDLKKYKKRFQDVKFFISPDISLLGDIDIVENLYRIKKSRIMSEWFTTELRAIVIPLISCPRSEYIEIVLKGLEKSSVVAFSTKGFIDDYAEKSLLRYVIKRTVDYLSLKTIIVYDCCGDTNKALELFDYPLRRGVKVIIPDNTIRTRNIINYNKRRGGCRYA